MYCDENKDLVADSPTDPTKWKNPSTMVFTYTPVEDPAVYEKVFKPFTDSPRRSAPASGWSSTRCRSTPPRSRRCAPGRLHVGGFSTGPTAFAVNLAGAVPFAVKGDAKDFQGYNLIADRRRRAAVSRSSPT